MTPDGGIYEMSRTAQRDVVDVAGPIDWVGPIADVVGHCRFGKQAVASEVFWAGVPSVGRIRPIVVDGAVTDLAIALDLPGGVRIR